MYSFEDAVSAQQENRPKIFDRIPGRVLPNGQIPQSNTEKYQKPLDKNVSDTENSPAISSSSICDVPDEERLSYVMQSLSVSIQKSTLPEVNVLIV